MRLVNWRTLIAGAASIALAACGDDVTVVQPTPVLTLNPASVTCVQGTTTAIGVSVSGVTGTPAVTFTSSGSAATVTGTGTGATISCAQVGSAVITVSVTANGQTVTGSVPVTVSAAPSPITSVTVSPNTATIAVGGTIALTPSATTSSASVTPTFTFTSVQPTIATVDANGVVRGVAPGLATIRVSTTQAPNIVAVATITVQATSAFIQSLAVQPSAVTLQTGGTQTLASTVTLAPGAPAGTSTGVTYTSSDTSVVRVSSTGVITAVRNGTAVVTVASQAAPTVTQAVSVTVRDPAPVRLTIQGVRFVNAAGNLVPVDPANPIGGTITATLNLDPGDFRPDSVRIRIGNAIVNCQRFSAELAAAYKAALTTGAADVQSIECPINTAGFNSTTGIANVLNGVQPLTAEVFFRPQGAAAGSQTQSASIQQNLTIQNQSGFFVNVTNTPTAAQAAVNATGQATGPQGVLWRAGSINVTVLPVNFVNVVNPGSNQTFTISLQDANGVIAQRTASQDANNAATYSATFPGASANAFNNTGDLTQNTLNGYTSPNAGAAPAFNPQGGYTGGGTLVVVGTAAGTANTVILNASGQPAGIGSIVGNVGFNNAVATPIFIDNQNPEARAQFVSPSFVLTGGSAGFINGSFIFSDSVQQAAAATLLADNNGVDRVSRQFFFASNPVGGPIPTAGQIVSGGTAVTNGGQIPQNVSQTAFVAAARLVDALGNATPVAVSAGSAAGAQYTFGVITVAPTITNIVAAAAGGTVVGSNQRLGASTAGTSRSIAFVATTTSGTAFPANLVVGTVQVVTPAGTFCATQADLAIAGAPNGGASVIGISTNTPPPCPQLAFADVRFAPGAANVPNGVWTVSVRARDVAGNLSDVTNRTFVVDVIPPSSIDNPLVSSGPLTGGQAESFSGTAHDNLSIVDQLALIHYPNSLGGADLLLRYNGAQISAPTSTSFVPNAALAVNVPFFIRSISLQPNSAANTFTAVGANAAGSADAANLGASDPGANWLYAPVGGFALDNTQTAPQFFGGPNLPVSASITYQPSNASSATSTFTAGAACTGAGGNAAFTLNSASTGCATSVTINLVLNGAANAPFQSQFTNIQLFVRSNVPGTSPFATTTAYTLAGSFGGSSTSTSSATGIQTTTASFSFTPGSNGIASFPSSAGTTNVDALIVASTASGYAIAFQLPTIALVNP